MTTQMHQPALVGLTPLPAPSALAKAVKAVIRAHPYTERGALDVDSPRLAADADILWRRLMELPPKRRESAIRDLRPLEYRLLAATARSRIGMETARAVLALAMTYHPLPDAPALAWEAWLAGDGGETTFRQMAEPVVAAAGVASRIWRQLLDADRPSEVVVSSWRRQASGLDDWSASPSVALVRYATFLNIVRRRLVAPGGLAALDARESSDVVERWAAALVPSADRDAWYASFLTETHRANTRGGIVRRWSAAHAVCEAILERAGPPADGKAFWSIVPPPVWEAFSLWLKDRELTAHLGGENDRVTFWRRYLVPMRRMETNHDCTVVFLHFDGWVAVQFVESGRATFLVRERIARGWRRLSDIDLYPEVLHLRRECSPSFLDSYTQRGYPETWQSAASDIVDSVFEMVRGELTAGGGT